MLTKSLPASLCQREGPTPSSVPRAPPFAKGGWGDLKRVMSYEMLNSLSALVNAASPVTQNGTSRCVFDTAERSAILPIFILQRTARDTALISLAIFAN